MAQMIKNLPAMQETQVQSLGCEDPLEKGMATHSSILAWRISWTEDPCRLHLWSQTRLSYWAHTQSHLRKNLAFLKNSSICAPVKVLVVQSHPTLCNPTDCSPPGSSVHGFFRQEAWRGLSSPSAGDLSNPGIEPGSLLLQEDSLPFEPPVSYYQLFC